MKHHFRSHTAGRERKVRSEFGKSLLKIRNIGLLDIFGSQYIYRDGTDVYKRQEQDTAERDITATKAVIIINLNCFMSLKF